jgi:hypothetical protein
MGSQQAGRDASTTVSEQPPTHISVRERDSSMIDSSSRGTARAQMYVGVQDEYYVLVQGPVAIDR